MRKHKYNAVKTGGYDSKKERARSEELKRMEADGLISDLKEQVKFELIPAQYEIIQVQLVRKTKEKRVCLELSCCYIADFTYLENGIYIVEDTKGVKTPEYRIKKKLMLYRHGIKIKET